MMRAHRLNEKAHAWMDGQQLSSAIVQQAFISDVSQEKVHDLQEVPELIEFYRPELANIAEMATIKDQQNTLIKTYLHPH